MGITVTSYERAVNKFTLLSDKEFQNLYLMPYKALFGNKKYLKKRKDPKFSFQFFKKYMESYQNDFEEYNSYNNEFSCKIFQLE